MAGCADYAELERREYAHAARACKIRLEHAREARDSMYIINGDAWWPGCARILAADTMPKAVRP